VAELGCRIVEELRLQESTETLSRWMAHRVAELIARGDAGDGDKAEATRLIVLLWNDRAQWSDGWPPPETEAMRTYIAGEEHGSSRHQNESQPATLLDVLTQLTELHIEERECWRSLALTETSLGDELSDALEEEADLELKQVLLFRSLLRDREAAIEHFGSDSDPESQRNKRLLKLREDLKSLGHKRGVLTKKGIALYAQDDEASSDSELP
jgi:hypothetical protein